MMRPPNNNGHGEVDMQRPLRRVPDVGNAAAYRQVRAALKKQGLSDAAAGALSTIWAYPDAVVPQIENPQRRRVPGGYLLTVTERAWTSRLLPDVENPRNADQVQFAISESAGDSRIGMPTASVYGTGEVAIKATSRASLAERLDWVSDVTRTRNEPHPDMAEQGIMDPPIGVATTVLYDDDEESPTTNAMVREGSTRISWAHYYQGLSAADVLFGLPRSASAMQEFVNRINGYASMDSSEITTMQKAAIRCAITEFELIIGVEPDEEGGLDLSQAIKARVAQDHLNPKTKWTEASRLGSLAEECLDELHKAGSVPTQAESYWLGGRLTRAQATAQKIIAHGDDRAARLIYLFTTNDQKAHAAVRAPIALVLTTEDGGKRPGSRIRVDANKKLPLAIELVAREFAVGDRKGANFRKNFKDVLPTNLSGQSGWKPTSRSPEALYVAALQEQRNGVEAGEATTELWIRVAYVLVKHNMIGGGRHDLEGKGDRRVPRDLMSDLTQSELGLHQLRQVLEDDRNGLKPRLVDPQGQPRLDATGIPIEVTNEGLRRKIAPKGDPGDPPTDGDPGVQLTHKVKVMRESIRNLDASMRDVESVNDKAGNRLIETDGAPVARLTTRQLRDLYMRAEAWQGDDEGPE